MAERLNLGFQYPLGADELLANEFETSGNIWYVDSQTGGTIADGYDGKSKNEPLESLQELNANASPTAGDVVVLLSGHVETLAANLSLTTRLYIYGEGRNAGLPAVTVAASADYNFASSAAGTIIRNVLWDDLDDDPGTPFAGPTLQWSGPGSRIQDCYFRTNSYTTSYCSLLIAASGVTVEDCTFVNSGASLATRGQTALEMASNFDDVRILGCYFDGGAYGWADSTGGVILGGTGSASNRLQLVDLTLVNTHLLVQHDDTNYVLAGYTSTDSSRITAPVKSRLNQGFGYETGPYELTCNEFETSGSIWYISSQTGGTIAGGATGRTKNDPLESLSELHTAASTAAGDTVVLLEDHVETLAAGLDLAEQWFIYGAGISSGKPSPQIDHGTSGYGLSLSANGTVCKNVYDLDGGGSGGYTLTSGTHVQLEDWYVECDNQKTFGMSVQGNYSWLKNCTFVSTGTSKATSGQNAMLGHQADYGRYEGCIYDGGAYGWQDDYGPSWASATTVGIYLVGCSFLRGTHAYFKSDDTYVVAGNTKTGGAMFRFS